MYKIVPTDSLQHSWAGSDKNYTADEKAKEKKYNHEYYLKNKEKWGVKSQKYTDGDSDLDSEANYDKKNQIGNSEFYAFKNKDGRWVITHEDTKWVLPEGVEPDDEMRKQLEAFKGFKDPSIKSHDDWDEAVNSIINKGKKEPGSGEFDVDAAAMDVIRGKYGNGQERKDELGDDYEAVQKRVNELMKEMGLTGSKSSSSKSSEESKDLKDRGYSSSTDGYNSSSKSSKSSSSSTAKKTETKDESKSSSIKTTKPDIVVVDTTKKKTVKHSYTVVSSDDELYHHGILGQKWGVRRFQNSDGSLTSEGRQRYGGKSKSTIENPPAVVKTKSSSNLSSKDVIKILNESENILDKSDNASKSISKIKKSQKAEEKEKQKDEDIKKVGDMSDQELREFLNRYDMEQRYYRIQNENKKDILTGREKVEEILEATKDVLAITLSAATIYAILKGK